MDKKTLIIEPREKDGKRANWRLRKAGKIPAVIYGQQQPIAINVNEHEFNSKFKVISENIIIDLKLGKKTYNALVKDYQEDIISGKILHLDFYEVEKGKLLRTHVPVHLEGTSIGVKEGGLLEHLLHEIEVECLPKDLPDKINIDISNLQANRSIHVAEITPIEGVRILNSPDHVVCLVAIKLAVEEEEEEEEEEEVVEEEEKENPEE